MRRWPVAKAQRGRAGTTAPAALSRRLAPALAIALVTAGMTVPVPEVAAQTIYRCGQEYRHQACDSGGRELALTSTPDDDERSAAEDVAERDRQLATRLARDRERREAAPVGGAAGIAFTPGIGRVDRTDRTRKRVAASRRSAEAPDFIAVDPTTSNPTRSRQP